MSAPEAIPPPPPPPEASPAPPPLASTPSQTVGPFLSMGLQPLQRTELVPPGSPGAVTVEGCLLDGAGEPVPDGVVEIWQADADGRRGGEWSGFGRSLTDRRGMFRFVTRRPGPVTLGSGAVLAPYLDVLVFARGLTRSLRTRCYFPDDPANGADPVLGAVPADRRSTLVAVAAAGTGALRFDIRLQGDGETVFFG